MHVISSMICCESGFTLAVEQLAETASATVPETTASSFWSVGSSLSGSSSGGATAQPPKASESDMRAAARKGRRASTWRRYSGAVPRATRDRVGPVVAVFSHEALDDP